jgi:zinc/manganese transport system permease protein
MAEIISIQGLPFLACLIMLAILCYIGIHVLKREIIFIDIALAQIAAVGAIAAHIVFHLHGHSLYAQALALGSTLVAAAFFAIVRRSVTQIPLEAVIGVSYAVSAAAALFLVGIAPGGHVHIQEMLVGSILWATWSDVLWSAVVFAVVGIGFYLFRKPLRAISDDYEGAAARGYNTLGWDFLFYALVGVVITVAVQIAGVVVVFTFLIIPATLSAALASGWAGRLMVAWFAGGISAALGLLFAARFDFSVGPAIAVFLGAALIVISVLRALRVGSLASAAAWLVMAAGLGVWFIGGSTARDLGPVSRAGGAPVVGTITHTHEDDPHGHGAHHDEPEVREIDAEMLAGLTEMEQLELLCGQAADDEERSLVIERALEVDVRRGARMAIDFLAEDPPLLFRLTLVEKLGETGGEELSYDIDQPFDSPSNQRAITGLERRLGLD